MKILPVLGAKAAGGAELFFIRLLRQMHQTENTQLHAAVRKNSWAADQLQQAGIPYTPLPFGGRLDMRTKPRLRTLIQQEHPDVILGMMNRACRNIPQVAVPRVGRLGGYYNLKNFRNMDHLICITPDLRQYCIDQGWPAEKVHFIPNFVEEPAPTTADDRTTARQAYNLPDDAFVCIMGGRLHQVKGIDTTLHALAHLPEHIHGLFVGSGPAETELKQLATDLGIAHRTHWVGWLYPITPAAQAADAWLMPSRHEPFGSSMLDAWAHQLPLIASNVDGPRHLLTDKKNALMIPPDDPAALAAAIQTLATDAASVQTLAQAGHAQYQAAHTPAKVTENYLNFFDSIRKK